MKRVARISLIVSVLVLFLACPPPALAWGKAGHRVVAILAANQLTPATQHQVANLLGPGVTLAEIANWADDVRPSRPNTAPWHYVNIPKGATHYDAARDCARGCVISAIGRSLRLLQDTSQSHSVREEALRWMVHFVADLHQPLHVVGEHRGGNDVRVQFMERQTNLHRLWDGDLIEHAYPNAVALYKQVQAALQAAQWQAWASGTPADWAMETYRVAQEAVYLFPASREIDDRYREKALSVIHEQLAKAAVRLAGVLNQALGRS